MKIMVSVPKFTNPNGTLTDFALGLMVCGSAALATVASLAALVYKAIQLAS